MISHQVRFLNSVFLGLIVLAVQISGQRNAPLQSPERPTHGLCENITIPICKDIGYNQTFMPNMLGHATQNDAGHEVTTYQPLIKINCSAQLNLFLCTLYLPVCTILTTPVPPCRSVCIAARDGCEGLMKKFNHEWPEHMACDKFPDPPQLCVGPERTSSSSGGSGMSTASPVYRPGDFNHLEPRVDTTTVAPINVPADGNEVKNSCPRKWEMKNNQVGKYELRLGEDDVVPKCGLPCKDVMFTDQQEEFARYWIGVWAILCFISTLFTVLTFLIDMRRFRYPERPIIFISGCYLIVSACYVVGFVLQDRVSCVTSDGGLRIVTQGTKNEGCTILFMLTYFFTMASSIWWVILTLTWVLAAGLKWGHEAIESNSQYFHLAAWAIPAIKSITIIAVGAIDGDVLSGVCFTGLSDKTSLIGYVIAPQVVYLTLGTIFLVAGFISLFNIRTVIKHSGTKTNKLEKLMIRIGIFSVLYTVPAITVIACNVYELLNRDTWLQKYRTLRCFDEEYRGVITCPSNYIELLGSKGPDFAWFVLKYLGYLIVGITSGFWIWSNKTMSSWGSVLKHLCCCCFRSPPREAAV